MIIIWYSKCKDIFHFSVTATATVKCNLKRFGWAYTSYKKTPLLLTKINFLSMLSAEYYFIETKHIHSTGLQSTVLYFTTKIFSYRNHNLGLNFWVRKAFTTSVLLPKSRCPQVFPYCYAWIFLYYDPKSLYFSIYCA